MEKTKVEFYLTEEPEHYSETADFSVIIHAKRSNLEKVAAFLNNLPEDNFEYKDPAGGIKELAKKLKNVYEIILKID